MHAAARYLNLFVEICLFRRGPQDVPASSTLLVICGLVYFAAGLLALQSMSSPIGNSVLYALTDMGTYGVITWLLLTVTRRRPRFLQTFTTMLGTGALLGMIAWPITSWQSRDLAEAGLPSLLLWGVTIWIIAVTAHILRQALEIRRGQAVALAMLYVIASMVLSIFFMARMGD
jgi:hypothetical protein